MALYRSVFTTTIELTVDLLAPSEDEAADKAWAMATTYLDTVNGDGRDITAAASLDGIGADDVWRLE